MIVRLYFIVVMTFLHGSTGDCAAFIKASKLPWTRKTNILRLVTKYVFQLQIKATIDITFVRLYKER